MSGPSPPDQDPFARQFWFDGPPGIGSRWWNERMAASNAWQAEDPQRREVLAKILLGAGVIGLAMMPYVCRREDDDGTEQTMDALDLQRRTTWDVGDVDRGLAVSDGWSTDCDGGERWRAALGSGRLAELFAPPEGRLRPFYAPTLFQAPDHSAGRSLVRHLFPIRNAEMDDAFDRGRALAEMFAAAGRPSDTAVVIDLPGPQSVALAAGLADLFAPVFTFDNWPHPRGVVPSHRTLDAALYYLPRFESAALQRAASAPPAFVLDASRLAAYRDAASDFDNRYVVSLPSFVSLQELGILHIMYVTASDPVRESDDLNADLVAFDGAGMSVRAAAFADFRRDPDGVAVGRVARPDAGVGSPVADRLHTRYHYSGGSSYHPMPRYTVFSSRAVGLVPSSRVQRPGGFGQVTVHRSGGTLGVGRGRSGSFGRGFSTFG